MAWIARRHAAEHRLDVRAVGLDVGHHDDHVARRQRPAVARGLLEHGQQLVVQDLHFALRVVGDVEAQRVVVVAPRFALGRVGRQRFEIEDGLLHLVQQGVAAGILEQVDAAPDGGKLRAIAVGLVEGVEQSDIVAPLFSPGGQQRIGVQVQVFVARLGGQAGLARMAALAGLEQLAFLDDVGPVMPARVGHHQQYLAEAGQCGERLQGLLRQ